MALANWALVQVVNQPNALERLAFDKFAFERIVFLRFAP